MSFADDIALDPEDRADAQRGAVLVAAAIADPEARAPARLREDIEARRAAAHALGRRRRPRWAGALAGLAAAAIAAVLLVVAGPGGSGDPSGPSVAAIARVAALPTSGPAPRPAASTDPFGDPSLAVRVGPVAFPDWEAEFDWSASGVRRSVVGGRDVTTVSYRNPRGVVAGYAIVDGPPLARGAGRVVTLGTTTFVLSTTPGRRTVTWVERERTCVLDAPAAVPVRTLLRLASSRVT